MHPIAPSFQASRAASQLLALLEAMSMTSSHLQGSDCQDYQRIGQTAPHALQC